MPTGSERKRAVRAGGLVACLLSSSAWADAQPPEGSPIYGVTIPEGYRQWELIAPALEAAPLDELRAVLGNPAAVAAYRAGSLPFPDGTVLVKLAWKRRHPLNVLLLRTYRIPRPVTVRVREDYGGCRSWLEITRDLPFEGTPVLSDEEFERASEEIAGIADGRGAPAYA